MRSSQPPFRSSQLDRASDPDSGEEHGPRLTVTQEEQLKVESLVAGIYRCLAGVPPHTQSVMLELWRDKHIEYLTKGFNQLGHTFQVLDANRPWLCYWILHSIALLGDAVDSDLESRVVEFLSRIKKVDMLAGPDRCLI